MALGQWWDLDLVAPLGGVANVAIHENKILSIKDRAVSIATSEARPHLSITLFPRDKPRAIARLGFGSHELVRTRLRHRRVRRGAS